MFENFVKYSLERGGSIKPLIIPKNIKTHWMGTGQMNPSVYNDNGKIIVNIRHTNYTLYHSENNSFEHIWGPLVYVHPNNDRTLSTKNYICHLTDQLDIQSCYQIDCSKYDKKPIWDFIGLEDIRIVKWDEKFFVTGVRRDTNTTGQGRMDLSEIKIEKDRVTEVSRIRVPAPENLEHISYCEKNWMPIVGKPYHFVKWSNPVEIVRYDPEEHKTYTIFTSEFDPRIAYDLRGGSQVIPYKDGYLAIQHVTFFRRNIAKRKDGEYRHFFSYWDKNWNLLHRSEIFAFLSGDIEFCCGLCEHNGDYLITFGFQDNAAYVMRVTADALDSFIKQIF